MERRVHKELHRELNKVLDFFFENERAILEDAPQHIVENAGASGMTQRIEDLTQMQLVDVLENARRRVLSENPWHRVRRKTCADAQGNRRSV